MPPVGFYGAFVYIWQINSNPKKMKTNAQLSTVLAHVVMFFLLSGHVLAQPASPLEYKKDCLIPPDWNQPVTTPVSSVIVIDANAKLLINGQRLNEDDVIGGFYLDENGIPKCGGMVCVQPNLSVLFVLFGDDPFTTKKEGFAPGEEILFKSWSWLCGRTCDMDSVIAVEFPKNTIQWQAWENLKIIYLAGELPVDCHEWQGFTLKLSKGWNEFVFPESDTTIDEFIKLFEGNLIMIKEKNGNGIFWPAKDIRNLKCKPGITYRIKVANDIEISLPRKK